MAAYVPPSIRTVRQDVQGSAVVTGGQVVPALIGQAVGKKVPVTAYLATMGASALFAIPDLGSAGPVLAVTAIRTKPSGGISFVEGTDFTFDANAGTIDFSAQSALLQPYLSSVTEIAGASTLDPAQTYYFKVTATRTADLTGPVMGETAGSNTVSLKPSAVNRRAVITFNPVNGAEGYRVYVSENPDDFGDTALIATLTGGYTNTFTYAGTAPAAGAPPGPATSGQLEAGTDGPYDGTTGDTLTVAIDGGAAGTITFTGTPAQRTGVGITYPVTLTGAETMQIQVNGGATYTVPALAAGAHTVADIVAAINAVLPPTLGAAAPAAGQVSIATAKGGTGQTLTVTGTLATAAGMTAGTTAGGGNVRDIDVITAQEIVDVINALPLAGGTARLNGIRPAIVSNTTGPGSTVLVTGGTANAWLAFPTTIATGAAARTASAFRRPALHGGAFYIDYVYLSQSYYTVKRFTKLNQLIQEYGVGSDLAIAGTLTMASSGRGNNASVVLAMSVPDDQLFTYQTALDYLSKRKDVDLVVPLTHVAGIENAIKAHCEIQSNVDNKRERIGVVGVAVGTALGDDITAGTAIYLAQQMSTRRMIVTYPWPVCDIQDKNGLIVERELPGWAMATAVAGAIASLPDRATPATEKQVQGIKRLGLELDETEMNLAGAAGLCVIEINDTGNFVIRDGVTSTLENEADQQISINLTDDFLARTLRTQLRQFRGRKLLPNVLDQIEKKTAKVLNIFVKNQLIVGFDAGSISAYQDPDRLTWAIITFTYQPVFPVRVLEFRYSLDLKPISLAA